MAVIDQDNFSNISWHSENAPDAATANPPSEEAANSEYPRRSGDDDDLAPGRSGEILECTVSEPHKENDGTKDAYVSYLITTNVSSAALGRLSPAPAVPTNPPLLTKASAIPRQPSAPSSDRRQQCAAASPTLFSSTSL